MRGFCREVIGAVQGADADPLEGRFGLMDALCGPGTYETHALTDGLGAPFRLYEPGITIKPYPNCWAHHKVLDSVLHLQDTHAIRPEQVERIEVDLQADKPTYRYLAPQTDLEARYSLGYGIALCLLDGALGLDQFADDRIGDARTKEMLARIHHVPQAAGAAQNEIVIRLKDGRSLCHRVAHSKGHPHVNPMSDDEVQVKFADCAGRLLPAGQVARAAELINGLEQIDDMAQVMDALIAPAAIRGW